MFSSVTGKQLMSAGLSVERIGIDMGKTASITQPEIERIIKAATRCGALDAALIEPERELIGIAAQMLLAGVMINPAIYR